MQCVLLAVRLARHTAQGWDNAAVPDDVEDIAKLLNAPPRVALAFLHKIDHPIWRPPPSTVSVITWQLPHPESNTTP